MYIRTNYGVLNILEGRYNGIFQDGVTYWTSSATYETSQRVAIFYSRDNDAFLGHLNVNNVTALSSRDSSYYWNFDIGDGVTNRSFRTILPPETNGGFASLACLIDNDGKMLLYAFRSKTSFTAEFNNVTLPTSNSIGEATFLNTGWSLREPYYDDVNAWLQDKTIPDPYSPGGASTHGGGGRSFDNTSDPVALPSLPADPVLNSGFVTMYQMDVLKLNSLANFLWDANLFDTETWQKVLANPFDAIISLNYIPASPKVLSDRSIQIGNGKTNVSAAPVADQFVQIDCQTLDVEEYGGTYLDYNPYTKVEIYLPYIGFRDLNTDEVMDKTLHLIYNVDIVTGTCVANILVDNTVLYQFTGNCALSIPLTGRDAGKNFAALLSLISAGAVIGAGAYSGTLDAAGAVKAVSATAQAVMGAKRNIQRSGSVSGAAGFMGGQTPYLIITRPRQALPESQNSFTGYPSFVTENLSDLSGFTTIESIHLEGIPGTSAEIAEIESLLSSGVIL